MPSFPQVNTWQGACHLPILSSAPISSYTHLKSPGWRTDCCAPSFYLGSESDVSDFTKIKTSKKTAICFRSRPVMTRGSIEKWHRGPYSTPFWHTKGNSKILKEPVTKPIWTIQIDFWEVDSIWVYDSKLEKFLESCTFSQIPSVLFLNSLRNSDGTSQDARISNHWNTPSPVSPAALSLSVCSNPPLRHGSQGRCDGRKCLSVLDKNQFHLQQ